MNPIPTVQGLPDACVLSRPVDIYRVYLADILTKLAGCEPALAYDAIQTSSTLANGDLTIPVPRLRLKGEKPVDHCADFAADFPADHRLFRMPNAAGIHLPIFFTSHSLGRLILPYVFQRRDSYGKNPYVGLGDPSAGHPRRRRVIVEFSSPNIAKEFHAGHLRSTIIGAFISNLYESMGWDEELAREPLKHLLDVYARINALFKPEQDESKKARDEGRDTSEIESRGLFAERNSYFRRMEDGDPEAVALWRRFRDISIERYISTYTRLNIAFDEYSGESQVQTSTVGTVERILKEKGVYEENKGSWIIDFKKYNAKALDIAVVRGRTGTTTYLLRDVAAVLEREDKYAFDKMIYVVSSEQDLYFQRHVNFGKVIGMSSRLGNVKLLGDILDQTGEAMHEVMRRNATKYAQVPDPEAAADVVGISAVMVQDMSGKRVNNYPFDNARMTSFEGDTGPYLQYCHARLNSILRKAGLTRDDIAKHVEDHPTALDTETDKRHCVDLLRLMAQYPDVTATALRNLEPSTILTYLFRLAHQLSSSYDVIQVTGTNEGRDVMLARAALYEGVRQILENGMKLLGITPVER
ncbi:Arginine--tRNA ligase, cytoplasmic [Tolypocladium ophioglossoides CBS 100239]|uniref:arginine--tRNA ligase n=1 Tax=Tolypocladium ophioglossoides (strain CBS 100239) TaxID=1163406 RepID=A0A0L0NNL3_TOLOC|nr:Arginine--tRNA ligase, cytoplasmic [Tolypocladium ophioglossoides CBS 100239]